MKLKKIIQIYHLFFFHENLHRVRQYCRPFVGHDVDIGHTGNCILKVTLRKIRESLLAPSHDQDKKPLDDQADEDQDAVYPSHNADGNPVYYTDEKLEPPGIVLIDKDLFWYTVRHEYSRFSLNVDRPALESAGSR